jgi:ribose 5-phosphate isomerase B
MRIAVATDHGGYSLKSIVIETVKEAGHEVIDFGTENGDVSVDFPDYTEKAARALQQKSADRAILICGSGVGVCIAANKFIGVNAAICHDTYSAHQGVEHDGMNTLCLGGRIIGTELASEIVKAFLSANFIHDPRFERRVNKIINFEKQEKL